MPKKIKYKVVKRKIKYPRLELKTGKLIAVIPRDGNFDVSAFVCNHKDWIKNKQNLIKKYSRKRVSLQKQAITKENLRKIIEKFIVKYFLTIKIKPTRIIIKHMKSKWGSCGSNKNLCFNSLLSRLPIKTIEYVVYHEMCHLKHRKHDINFKLLLKRQYDNPEKLETKLFSYWFAINKKIS